jgi:hypothetical protein
MKVKVEFIVVVPDDVTDEDLVEEWLRFRLNDNGTMAGDNPLVKYDVEPIFGTLEWEVW